MSVEVVEFAARRRVLQEAAIDLLRPAVKRWISDMSNPDTLNDLSDLLARLYSDAYLAEDGLRDPRTAGFLYSLRGLFNHTTDKSDPEQVATWLAVATLNAAVVQAGYDDPRPIQYRWTTMHDSHVRHAHEAADQQTRPPGTYFHVGGENLRYPGDPRGRLDNTINCRCVLQPVPFYPEAASLSAAMKEKTMPLEAPLAWHGVLAPEEEWSGDGRRFAAGSLRNRDLPLPLTWQKAASEGHDGSVVIGRIDSIERVDNMIRGEGVFIDTPETDEVVGLLAEFGRFGVSIDADDSEFEFDEESGQVTFNSARIASASLVAIPAFASAYVAFGTWAEQDNPIVPSEDVEPEECDPDSPDYEACLAKKQRETEEVDARWEKVDPQPSAGLDEFGRGPGWVTNPEATRRLWAYWTQPGHEGYAKVNWGVPGDFNRCRAMVGEEIGENSPDDLRFLNQICAQWHHDATGFWPGRAPGETLSLPDPKAMVAPAITLVAAGGKKAPAAWFANPNLTGPTHLTVTEDGRVFGHIAEWKSCHVGYKGVCVAPPSSLSDYAYYATGQVLLDDGSAARTGIISLGGGHAGPRDSARVAAAHYDSTSAAAADVSVGEDEHGIWCAGWIRPGVGDNVVTALRASDVSGDWREISGHLEMIAALAVNSGGFPIAAVQNQVQVALVASGVVAQQDEPMSHLVTEVVAALRRIDRMAELRQRVGV